MNAVAAALNLDTCVPCADGMGAGSRVGGSAGQVQFAAARNACASAWERWEYTGVPETVKRTWFCVQSVGLADKHRNNKHATEPFGPSLPHLLSLRAGLYSEGLGHPTALPTAAPKYFMSFARTVSPDSAGRA